MRCRLLFSFSRLFWTASLVATLSVSASAAKTKSPVGVALPPDFLAELSPEWRSHVIQQLGHDRKALCELIVMQQFGLKFRKDATLDAPSEIVPPNLCGNQRQETIVRINSPEALTRADYRAAWAASKPVHCEYKRHLSKALARAATKLNQNPGFGFPTESEILAGKPCTLGPQTMSRWMASLNGAYCYTVRDNIGSASALECFYRDECRMGCGPAASTLDHLAAYELFAGVDGVMDPTERDLFDTQYARLIAVGQLDDSGLPASGSPFVFTPVPLASHIADGPAMISGVLGAFASRTQPSISGTTPEAFADANQNFIVISTSNDAYRQLRTPNIEEQIRVDMQVIGETLRTFWKENPRLWEEVVYVKNYSAIADRTYSFRNLPSDPAARARALDSIRKIQEIYAKPMFRQTEVRLHPHGNMPLGAVPLFIFGHFPDGAISFLASKSNEEHHRKNYFDALVSRCAR
jgi:hypothetical protein